MAAVLKAAQRTKHPFIHVFCVSTCAGSIGSLVYVGFHTLGLERWRQYNATALPTGEPELAANIKQRVIQMYNELPLSDIVKEKVKFFETYSNEFFRAGILRSKEGVVIGIPSYFTNDNVSNIDKDKIRMFNMPLDWKRKDANDYLKTLVISEKAQKAAIAFELVRTEENEPLLQAVLLHISMTVTAFAYLMWKAKHDGKYGVLAVTMAAFLLGYLLAKDYISRAVDRECDKKIAGFGTEYVEGSMEYLEKSLQRNIAARSLLLGLGKRTYRNNGDPNFLLRSRTEPLTNRRQFFKSRMETLAN